MKMREKQMSFDKWHLLYNINYGYKRLLVSREVSNSYTTDL